MTGAAQALNPHYMAARQALEAHDPARALPHLEALLRVQPRFAPGLYLMGVTLSDLGDLAGAERAYRAALAIDPTELAIAIELSRLLGRQGRAAEAAQITAPMVAGPSPHPQALGAHIQALVAAGRREEALPFSRKAIAAGIPNAALGTAQLLADLGQFAEAETLYRQLLAREPDDERLRRGLARVMFSLTGDVDAANAVLDEALARRWSPAMVAYKAKLLNHAGRAAEAYAALQDALQRSPNDPGMLGAAATAASLSHQYEAAYELARRAHALAPDLEGMKALLAETCIGSDRPEQAAPILDALRRAQPLDQKLIALSAMARRLMGDDRYGETYDYDRFVRAYTIAAPPGWASLDGFMADLRARLHAIHDGLTEPLDQSVRQGSQTNANLIHSNDPLIQALFRALDAPVADYVASLGRSDDPIAEPLRARNRGGWRYNGAWSVRLRPGGGHHVNHIHPEGWISSAFYIDVPPAIETGHEGWIQFGEPGVPTKTALGAEHFVKPEPGRLVLFPSYMWHGALPFGGTERRLTFAFDVVAT